MCRVKRRASKECALQLLATAQLASIASGPCDPEIDPFGHRVSTPSIAPCHPLIVKSEIVEVFNVGGMRGIIRPGLHLLPKVKLFANRLSGKFVVSLHVTPLPSTPSILPECFSTI